VFEVFLPEEAGELSSEGSLSLKCLNPKLRRDQYRNSKQIRMTQIQMTKTKRKPKASYHAAFVLDFEHLNFGFVSYFVLRASN
jgi:hypothetical protein